MSSTVGVYIGRFQPFHNGHKEIVDRMLADGNEFNYLLLGDSNERSKENPFNFEERADLILHAYADCDSPLIVDSVSDHPDDSIWAEHIRLLVEVGDIDESYRLYGAHSDASSFYLNMFPEWEKRLTILDGTYRVHATTIRMWIRTGQWNYVKNNVPPDTFEYLKKLVETEPDTCHKWLRE